MPNPNPVPEEAARGLLEAAGDGVLVLSGGGEVLYANPAAGRLLGRAPADLIGRPFGLPVVPDGTAEVDLLAGPECSGCRVAEIRCVPVAWPGGPAVLATLRDVTARKRAEEGMRLLADAGRALGATLDEGEIFRRIVDTVVPAMADRASVAVAPSEGPTGAPAPGEARVLLTAGGESFGVLSAWRDGRPWADFDRDLLENLAARAAEALANACRYREVRDQDRRRLEFLATLGHELRNPLAALRHAVEVLRARRTGPEAEESLSVAARQVSQMGRLVDDLLEASRLTRGVMRLERSAVDLREAAGDALKASRAFLEGRGLSFELAAPETPLWVDGDADRLEQVVGNLLNNAGKFTDPGGRVRLSLAADGGSAVLAVEDTGLGIAPEMLPGLFNLFEAGAAAPDRPRGGLGLGLSLARRLAEMHGGTLSAFSAGPGAGSRFEMRLPLCPAPAAPAPAQAQATPAPAGCRVLIVEDNADSRVMLEMLLGFWGHAVRSAGDGASAVAAAREFSPDVCLIDIGLPDESGYEVARRVRLWEGQSGRPTPARLVAMTGYAQSGELPDPMGAFDLRLIKPLDLAELERLLAG